MRQRVLFGSLVMLALLLAGVAFVYAFGAPQSPATSQRTVAAASEPAVGEDASVSASAQAPPPDPASPLAVEIPGCVCHSGDPKLVEEHASYRMNQCFGCHSDGVPGMGR